MKSPTAPVPASVLSALTVDEAFKVIPVSALLIALPLELIANPTTEVSPMLSRSVWFRTAFTFLPSTLIFDLCTISLLVY